MSKLTTMQRQILEQAAAADDDCVDRKRAPSATAASLVRARFMMSLPAEGGASRLMITSAGRAALADEKTPAVSEPAAPQTEEHPTAASPRVGKIDMLLDLLRRPGGASVPDMMAATGWQAHSVRGALSGAIKKQRGLAVTSEKADAGRIYRVIEGAGA
jgi:hypothetical protein